ncbi:MAG: VWA domain-containing protein, partial [Bacteroidota bacterium]
MMNKKTSILLAFLFLSIYHLPPVKAFFRNTTEKIWQSDINITIATRSDQQHRIQLALLLDTSNSMDGLIEQAKSQLWKMVNELAESTKDGRTPEIEIALYEYGNDQLSPMKGYIREVVPLTSDLDHLSEKLFELNTDGGEEYCGFALKTAIENLTWSDKADNLKIVFIAGNEGFDQGP